MESTGMQTLNGGKTGPMSSEDHYFVPPVSAAMRLVEQAINSVAPTELPVLLVGESGSGKEVVARHIHRISQRSGEPFTKIVCGALTPESFETLRNGLEKENGHNGSIRVGTLFLDEFIELTPACQASFLHAFPDGELVAPMRSLSARIISATGRTLEELEEALHRGTLRKDLYYRINGVCLRLPPLRERREDIPALVEHFLQKGSLLLGRARPPLSPRALEVLRDYSWPGNVRELENTVTRMVALGNESAMLDLGPFVANSRSVGSPAVEKLSLKQAGRAASRQAEKELILKVLERTHWNRKRAAQQLQISYKALLYKLRQMGLEDTGSL